MVPIPGGEFVMGSPETEKARKPDEGPQHKVKVTPFWMGQCEVTWNEYELFMYPDEELRIRATVPTDAASDKLADAVTHPSKPYVEMSFGMGKDGYPAISMTQHGANKYCQWLSAKTGHFYRLPTEAEWEYAARGHTVTARYWGDNPDDACKYANVADKTAQAKIPGAPFWRLHNCTDGFAYTAPVGSFKANAFGLKDMLGNVWEWTEDSFHDSYKEAPVDGSAWQGNGEKRVLRGGSWNNGPTRVRVAKRGRDIPTTRFCNIGFRLARTLP
jgi:formylglycine-generating enzyme required for sulfatase activity